MKRKFTLILTLLLFMVVPFIYVKADNVSVTPKAVSDPGQVSAACVGGTCLGFGDNYKGVSNKNGTEEYFISTFGIRVTLIDSNGTKVKNPLDIWATESMKEYATNTGHYSKSNINLYYDRSNKTITYDNDLFNATNSKGQYYLRLLSWGYGSFADYIKDEMDYDKVKEYLAKIGISESEAINYFLKIEPIYALIYTEYGTKKAKFVGNTKEVLGKLNEYGGYAKEIAYGEHGTWNVIRNFILTTYINQKPVGLNVPYFNDEIPTDVGKLYEKYYGNDKSGNHGLSVGYISLSDILKSNSCEATFISYKDGSGNVSMQNRIKIYHMIKRGELECPSGIGEKACNGLLNMSYTDPSKACSTVSCNIETCSGCLSNSVGYNTEFNSRNLSCYNEIRDGLYCFNSFELSNSLNSNIFSINQGGVLLKNVSITGALTTSCYGGYANSTFRYSDYIKELKIENAPNSKKLSTGDIIRSTSFKDNLFTTKLTTNYNLPSVYASILSGKASYEDCDNRRFLGYGIITKFIEENGTFNGTFSSKLKIDNKKFNVNADTLKGDCTYYSTPELIDNGGLNLEFRIIDTGNPFPGKSGSNNRKVGLNWCDEDNCTQDNNTLITKYIKDANNSYNKNKEAQPKYKITLSSSDIKVIKEYNKKAEAYGGYDDNTLNCNDENNCSSTFIEGLKSGILKYYVDGNRNSEEYIGNMLNRLIINK